MSALLLLMSFAAIAALAVWTVLPAEAAWRRRMPFAMRGWKDEAQPRDDASGTKRRFHRRASK